MVIGNGKEELEYKFVRVHKNYNGSISSIITIETDNVSLDALIEDFRSFLLAAGYQPEGIADYLLQD
jgi:hypothetical protein